MNKNTDYKKIILKKEKEIERKINEYKKEKDGRKIVFTNVDIEEIIDKELKNFNFLELEDWKNENIKKGIKNNLLTHNKRATWFDLILGGLGLG